eukprot:m.17341 g.17341  ORF g.17341 m.17341 type:complete len:334 (+) comp7122_c0_seq1:921-1922(+)
MSVEKSKRRRCQRHTSREPMPKDFGEHQEEYFEAWQLWREVRDLNNASVRRSRLKRFGMGDATSSNSSGSSSGSGVQPQGHQPPPMASMEMCVHSFSVGPVSSRGAKRERRVPLLFSASTLLSPAVPSGTAPEPEPEPHIAAPCPAAAAPANGEAAPSPCADSPELTPQSLSATQQSDSFASPSTPSPAPSPLLTPVTTPSSAHGSLLPNSPMKKKIVRIAPAKLSSQQQGQNQTPPQQPQQQHQQRTITATPSSLTHIAPMPIRPQAMLFPPTPFAAAPCFPTFAPAAHPGMAVFGAPMFYYAPVPMMAAPCFAPAFMYPFGAGVPAAPASQ